MSIRPKTLAIALMAVFGGLGGLPAQAQDYDLVILNGRVMDPESNLDAVRNVGVKDGKIAAVTEQAITGKETIDASGHVVAPGFIDLHFHNVSTPFGQKLGLRDGVTTQLEIEAGVFPVDMWYSHMKGKSQANYGATVATMSIRETVLNPKFKTEWGATINDLAGGRQDLTHVTMDWSTNVANEDQLKEIFRHIEDGLKQGALGVGVPTGYMVDGITQRETYGSQVLAGKYGRVVGLHGRFSGQDQSASGMLGTDEQLGALAAGGGGLVVQHMTAQCLDLSKYCQQMIDGAAGRGLKVIAENYPYTYGATIVGADYLKPANYGPNMGHTYKDIVEIADMKPLTKERYEKLVKTAPMTNVTFENVSKKDLMAALAHSTSIIGSDAFPYANKSNGSQAVDWDTPFDSVNGHPRGAGTHAKLLQLVREEKLMPLMLAVSKMTYMVADFMADNGAGQLASKGRIKVGADADITIFDPKTVRQNATPAKGGLPSTGIPFVIVNGTVVVKDSKVLKDVNPGQMIRNPIME
jgi:hypothetical protein